MKLKIVVLFLFCAALVFSQGRSGRNREVVHPVSNKEIVQSVFPEAAEVKKVNDYWYYIQDSKGKVLGYALNSNTHCEGIIGYGKQTPVMIITNKSKLSGLLLLVELQPRKRLPKPFMKN